LFYKIFISKKNKKIFTIANGEYNSYDVFKLVDIVITSTDYNPYFSILIDITEVTYLSNLPDFIGLSKKLSKMNMYFKGKIVFVVKNIFLYRLFRLASKYSISRGIKVRIFIDYDDAHNWFCDKRMEPRDDTLIS